MKRIIIVTILIFFIVFVISIERYVSLTSQRLDKIEKQNFDLGYKMGRSDLIFEIANDTTICLKDKITILEK